MGRLPQLIATYLALSLALAGAVGTSPLLHRLIEHGDHGAEHSHRGRNLAIHTHASPHVHPHPHEHSHSDDGEDHEHPHAHQEHSAAEDPTGSSSVPGHHHDSLPELLASGLVEQSLTTTPVLVVPFRITFVVPASFVSYSSRHWDSQTAGRAPPPSAG